MRRSDEVLLWGYGGLIVISTFSLLVHVNLHSENDKSKSASDSWADMRISTNKEVLVMTVIIVVIICTERWTKASLFSRFWRMFAACFLISLVWNWFYLYKMACAEHQAKMVKWEEMTDKCTGGKKNNWWDNFKDWYRTTFTLQDDPCKEYFELLTVHPILQVPPTKVLTMTLTTLFTDPLIHIGQGISAFHRALLKDLPITLQIPVLILTVLSSLVFLYIVGQAAVFWCLQGKRQDPPPGITDQPDAPPYRLSGKEDWLSLETLQNAERIHSRVETDTQRKAVAEEILISIP